MRVFVLAALTMLAACNPDSVEPPVANNAAGNQQQPAHIARSEPVSSPVAAAPPPSSCLTSRRNIQLL